MKLSELEPLIDPRRPLRLAGVNTTNQSANRRPQLAGVPRQPQALGATLTTGDSQDLAAIDRALGVLDRHSRSVGRQHATGQQDVRRTHARPRLEDLRSRAVRMIELCTGASIGLLSALWRQEAEQLRGQLQAEIGRHTQQLRVLRAAASGDPELAPMRAELDLVRAAWIQLDGFEVLEQAFQSSAVLALSPGAADTITARKVAPLSRLEHAFAERANWGSGLVWLPARAILLAWSTVGSELHLFELAAADVANWVRSLQTPAPQLLHWKQSVIPSDAHLRAETDWKALAVELTQLLTLGQTPSNTVPPRQRPTTPGTRSFTARTPELAAATELAGAPTTRFMITAAEGRNGIAPFDMATGAAPATADWVPARFRNTWSAEHERYLRVWTDAYPRTLRKPPNERVLVTLLP